MNVMVKNLLTLNQLEFGSDEVQFERFDIVRLVKGVIASCEILVQQAGAKISFISDESICVWADEFKTEQVVRNYLTNAIHHVGNEKRIEVRIENGDGKVRITVFNSGNSRFRKKIFRSCGISSIKWTKRIQENMAATESVLSIVKAIMERSTRNTE